MVSCCMESFICLWYHVLEMVVVDVNGYNQNHRCEWMDAQVVRPLSSWEVDGDSMCCSRCNCLGFLYICL